MECAAINGNIEVIKAMDKAVMYDHLAVVRFLQKERDEGCTRKAMDMAAICGHIEMVRFLHEECDEGCSKSAMNTAARNGHIEVITYLHERERAEKSVMKNARKKL
jgi:Ankyrin repeats (3 copies)